MKLEKLIVVLEAKISAFKRTLDAAARYADKKCREIERRFVHTEQALKRSEVMAKEKTGKAKGRKPAKVAAARTGKGKNKKVAKPVARKVRKAEK